MKIIKNLSIIVIVLFLLSVYGWMVSKVATDSMQIGFLTKPLKYLYEFPDLFTKTVDEVKSPPRTFRPIAPGFEPVNKLSGDVLVLSTHTNESNSRSIILVNLKTDSVLYEWTVEHSFLQHDRILHPLLLPQKSLIYAVLRHSVYRIDSLSNVIWKQDSIKQHHSMNRGADGNIWICSYQPGISGIGKYKLHKREVFFKDNYITQLDDETGRILFHKSVAEILAENHLSSYLLKSSVINDPLHINDVEPVLSTSRFFNKGDLFVSFRNPSIIMQYRPSTNEVIRIIEGPFVSQHDVDILNDSTLIAFNNNTYTKRHEEFWEPGNKGNVVGMSGNFYSNIVTYNFSSGRFDYIGENVFRKNKIFTNSEGLVEEIGPDTYFIEEQNRGVLWIISDDEVVYKNVFKSHHKGHYNVPNWTRVISSDL